MICSSLRTVVYAFSRPIAAATSRTVEGPRAQSTRRMATSASVGLRRLFTRPIVYDNLRRCQYESLRRRNGELRRERINRRNGETEDERTAVNLFRILRFRFI